jgi:hypothetical protein
VVGCCESGDEPSGSCLTELVTVRRSYFHSVLFLILKVPERIVTQFCRREGC